MELKDCPFCGDSHVSHSIGMAANGADCPYIECEGCGATTEPDVWNRRSPSPAVGELEQSALAALLALAQATYDAADSAEDMGDGTHKLEDADFGPICDALDRLDVLPDDQPGYTMGPAAKAVWALRALLSTHSPKEMEDD